LLVEQHQQPVKPFRCESVTLWIQLQKNRLLSTGT
jgi:hypothetical protein